MYGGLMDDDLFSDDLKADEEEGEVRDLLLYPEHEEELRGDSAPVEAVDTELNALIDDLFATMRAYKGIGLSAPQVGVSLRVAVVGSGPAERVLINPEVLDEHGEVTTEEGCLSLPGMSGEVTRPAKVRIRTLDRNGAAHEFVEEGRLAVALQHEIDHLDGVLMFDRFSPVERRMELKRYRKLRKAASREGFDLLDVRKDD